MTGQRVTIIRLIGLLRSHWFLLVAATCIGGALGAVYSLTRRPIFESQALLAPVRQVGGSFGGGDGLGGLAGRLAGFAGFSGLTSVGSTLNESVAVLNSRQFALRFMRAHDVLQYLFPKMWDAKEMRWTNANEELKIGPIQRFMELLEPVPDSKFAWRGPGPSPDKAVERFNHVRVVTIDRRTGFIRLLVRGPSPEIAQQWARSMIEDLNSLMLNRSLRRSRREVQILSKFISEHSEESVRDAAVDLLRTQLRREVVAESRKEFAVETLDPPSLPAQRFYPARAHITIKAALLGFLFACVWIVGREAAKGGGL